jgi:hypothetical protein
MAQFSVSAAVGSGFDLIRTRPLTVLLWGVAQFAMAAVILLAFFPLWLSMIGTLGRQAVEGGRPDPAAFMGQMAGFQGVLLLVNFGALFARALLSCAVWRSVLHPQQSAYAYFRVSMAELYVFLLTVGASYAAGFVIFIPLIPIAIVIVGLVAAHAYAAAIVVGVVAVLALLAAVLYLALRFSLVGPMIVQDGKFHLMESWTLTRGHVGGLFATGLLLVLMVIVLEIVVVGVAMAVLVGVAGGLGASAAGHPEALRNLLGHPGPDMISRIIPWVLGLGVIFAPLAGALYAVMLAPWSRILRDLTEADATAAFV